MLSRLPWTPAPEAKPKPLRRINRDRRRHLVDTIAAILRSGDPTPFAFEASCRHGLRAALCLHGWRWQEADAMAAEIVTLALRIIGARRPTWAEGQPEFVQNGAGTLIERTRCIRCHDRLPQGHHKFCGQLCATAHHLRLIVSGMHRSQGLCFASDFDDLCHGAAGHRTTRPHSIKTVYCSKAADRLSKQLDRWRFEAKQGRVCQESTADPGHRLANVSRYCSRPSSKRPAIGARRAYMRTSRSAHRFPRQTPDANLLLEFVQGPGRLHRAVLETAAMRCGGVAFSPSPTSCPRPSDAQSHVVPAARPRGARPLLKSAFAGRKAAAICR